MHEHVLRFLFIKVVTSRDRNVVIEQESEIKVWHNLLLREKMDYRLAMEQLQFEKQSLISVSYLILVFVCQVASVRPSTPPPVNKARPPLLV